MTAGDENERLRKAFEGAAGAQPSQSGCPGDEELWRAARGELPEERKRAVLDHLLDCDACAQSCAIACDLMSQESVTQPAGALPKSPRDTGAPPAWIRIALPAAALLILAFVWIRPFDRFEGTPVEEFRELGAVTIDSLLDEAIPLPRDRCELRWSEGPEGTLYSVAVSSESLTVLARADELDTTAFVVPQSALDGVASGATFLWRVEALLPDTTRVTSPVFRARLE